MNEMINDGIIFFDEPETVCFLDFAFEHMGCDSIATRESAFNPSATKIVAYASDRQYNDNLRKILLEKYGCEDYVTMKHMSEAEAYSID